MDVDKDGKVSWTEKETEVKLANLSKVATYKATENKEKGTFDFSVEFVVEAGNYTITEKNSAIEGFREQTTSVKTGKASIAAKDEMNIDLKDDYKEIITGKLTIGLKDDYTKETKPDKKVTITVIRRNEVTGEPIIGAKLQLIDSEGKVIDEWITDGKPHTVTGLKPGETYTIHEVETPEGEKPAPDVKVTIDEDGKITGVKLDENGNIIVESGKTDDDIEVNVSFKISKIDEQGNPLAGAEFVLKDSNGNKLAEWKSEKTATDISSHE